jgi:hypothetical protein
MPRCHRHAQQVERAGDVHIDERLGRVAGDIRLVQGAGMDHGVHSMVGKGTLHPRTIRDRADDLRIRPGCDIKADDRVASGPEAGCEEPAQPAGGAGQ